MDKLRLPKSTVETSADLTQSSESTGLTCVGNLTAYKRILHLVSMGWRGDWRPERTALRGGGGFQHVAKRDHPTKTTRQVILSCEPPDRAASTTASAAVCGSVLFCRI